MEKKEYSLDIGGEKLVAQFSNLADQADGSVIMRYGNTALLATVVMSKNVKEGLSYFPLKVDYEERFYAAGQILGSRFMRREGRPSDEAVLTGRVVDRTIRPLFNQGMRYDVQVVITVLSMGEYDPDVLGVIGASLALATSDIPWNGPVSAVRIGKKNGDGEFDVNSSYAFRDSDEFSLDLLACGKEKQINMIEVGAQEVKEDIINEALQKASKEIEKVQEWQKKIVKEIGKEKRDVTIEEVSKEIIDLFTTEIEGKLEGAIFSGPGKASHHKLGNEWKEILKEKLPDANVGFALDYLEEKADDLIHTKALEEDKRADGRGLDEVRGLYAQAGGISEMLHGTGIFYRGGTHVMSVLTLGGPDDAQLIDGMEIQMKKRFFHHYNFPPFSVGETGRVGGFNRRQIGHGALAEKALRAVLPSKEVFPYTIRVVSEAFASNGSTSMASVCGGTLALMDAGVPIKAPVAGIAIGLMLESRKLKVESRKQKYKLLTDIQGPEDHHGDMDFKVAGTREGVTAVQMDVKVDGVSITILSEAFEKAKTARLKILDVIENEIAKPRPDISPRAPKIIVITIKPSQEL